MGKINCEKQINPVEQSDQQNKKRSQTKLDQKVKQELSKPLYEVFNRKINLTENLDKPIDAGIKIVPLYVKKNLYRIHRVPTGKKGKLRWIFNPYLYVKEMQSAHLKFLYM